MIDKEILGLKPPTLAHCKLKSVRNRRVSNGERRLNTFSETPALLNDTPRCGFAQTDTCVLESIVAVQGAHINYLRPSALPLGSVRSPRKAEMCKGLVIESKLESQLRSGAKPRSGFDGNEIKDEERNRNHDGHGLISKRRVENERKYQI
ncbi:hypothetical protein EVAR_63998_1 [Eumeta japonica]|uniref:Uncharacterized protein n=1 Tax=Eumeta variegata TaxID=151549 RepID=A0A4C1YY64_EUMVA|nr:hypothetical protein EVAR_63998_1 [Eumeta japonica]